MGWHFEGTYVESCSCEVPCPCVASMALGADRDYCRLVLGFNIASGDIEGTDVGGVGCTLIVDAPKLMTDGGWKVGLYISDDASDEQAEALGRVYSGALGGPPAALGPLIDEFLGVERVPMEFRDDGRIHSLKIGDAVDIEVEDVVSFGSETGEAAEYRNVFHPAGDRLTIAKAARAKVNAFGIAYEGSSAGISSPRFAWAG